MGTHAQTAQVSISLILHIDVFICSLLMLDVLFMSGFVRQQIFDIIHPSGAGWITKKSVLSYAVDLPCIMQS